MSVNVRRLIAPFFAAASLALLPWAVWLSLSLPARHETENWRTVWAGFDLALAAALGLTALASLRDAPWLEAVAAVSGTLLCTDAWFDITLEAGGKHLTAAVIQAVAAELPLAAICFSVALDAERMLARALPTSPAGRRGLDRASPRPHTPDPRPREAHSPGE